MCCITVEKTINHSLYAVSRLIGVELINRLNMH